MTSEKLKVKLSDILDAIEFSSAGPSFINLKTGEVCSFSEEAMNQAEEEDDDDDNDYPEWQKEEIQQAKQYLENVDDYLDLPSQEDVEESRIMEDFAYSLKDEKISQQLLISLKGSGAFRRFKDNVRLLGIDKEWYQFRDEKYQQFAFEWCEANDISIELSCLNEKERQAYERYQDSLD